ncbi:MAG: hypothetical protein Q7T57_00295, partial [Dehalococcoidales bacterium]|nr:hypothetical protein [Dehalococcoidales bacterium]
QIITVARDLLIGAAAAYKAEFPYFDMQFGYGTTNGLVKGAFNAGGWDFAVATAAPVQSDYLAKPALGYYPLQSNGQ